MEYAVLVKLAKWIDYAFWVWGGVHDVHLRETHSSGMGWVGCRGQVTECAIVQVARHRDATDRVRHGIRTPVPQVRMKQDQDHEMPLLWWAAAQRLMRCIICAKSDNLATSSS